MGNLGSRRNVGNRLRLDFGRVALAYNIPPARIRGDTAYWFSIGTHNEFEKIIQRFISGG